MKTKLLTKIMLLLCALVVGSGSVWAQSTPSVSDFIWPEPIVDENFNSVSTVSATSKVAATTSITKHGVFNGLYNNNTANTYGINNTSFSSNSLFLTSGNTTSPIVVGITGKAFGKAGAYAFKCKKTNYAYIGLASDGISGTAYTKAGAFCYMGINNGAITISNGTSWKDVITVSDGTDVEICVIYNNTSENLTYGNKGSKISIAKQTAHVYVNGTCVMNGASPKAMSIVDCEIGSFRVVTCQKNATMNIDDVKIYNALPTDEISNAISTLGWNTFSSPYALDFTSVSTASAYMVTGASGNTLTLDKVTGTIPANTGLLVNGTAGDDVDIPVVASSATVTTSNLLKPGTGEVISGATKYVLVNRDDKAAFASIASQTPTIAIGKAYLDLNGVLARSFFFLDEETTGINEVNANELFNGAIYNLNGTRVTKPSKGLYIMNGKKLIIK